MSEIGLVEIFSMAEAAALIATLFVIVYYSKKQAQSLSVDKVLSKVDAESPEMAYAYDILFTFAHAFHMRQRKVLNDNEWTGINVN